jgi:hypothetical protein
MNVSDINKLKKSELVELSHKLQNERSELTGTIVTLRENETELRGRIEGFEVERSELLAEKELLRKKYGQCTLPSIHMALHSKNKMAEKAKRLLRASKNTMEEEILRIKKPKGQVDRNYHLHEAMTGDGQLEISDDTYWKILVSVVAPLHNIDHPTPPLL